MKQIGLEFYKLRYKHIFLMITLFLFIEIIWAFTAASMSISRNSEIAKWETLIMMLSTMNGLFLPILSAICVSRICDIEHKGNTWKMLLAVSVKRGQLYASKYIYACLVMLWMSILQIFFICAFGMFKGFEQPVPILLLTKFFAGVFLTNLAVIALQLWASMAIKNQAFALALGMIGGFVGLVAELLPLGVRRFFVWSYYTGLSPVRQNYVNEQMQLTIQHISTLLPLMAVLVAAGIIIYLAGMFHISRQEV